MTKDSICSGPWPNSMFLDNQSVCDVLLLHKRTVLSLQVQIILVHLSTVTENSHLHTAVCWCFGKKNSVLSDTARDQKCKNLKNFKVLSYLVSTLNNRTISICFRHLKTFEKRTKWFNSNWDWVKYYVSKNTFTLLLMAISIQAANEHHLLKEAFLGRSTDAGEAEPRGCGGGRDSDG